MGTAERREREKQHRINTIMDAALDVFAEKGLQNATMDDVAQKAEISKGTIYLYFKSKEHLFFALDNRAGQMLRERFLEAYDTVELGLDKIKAIGRAYFKFSFDFPNYFKAMNYVQRMNPETFAKVAADMSPNGIDGLKDSSLAVLRKAIVCGQEDGSVAEDIDPWLTAVLLWATSNGVITMIKNRGDLLKMMDFPIDQLYPTKELMVERGLAKPKKKSE